VRGGQQSKTKFDSIENKTSELGLLARALNSFSSFCRRLGQGGPGDCMRIDQAGGRAKKPEFGFVQRTVRQEFLN
jgi:hypothetical protein